MHVVWVIASVLGCAAAVIIMAAGIFYMYAEYNSRADMERSAHRKLARAVSKAKEIFGRMFPRQ